MSDVFRVIRRAVPMAALALAPLAIAVATAGLAGAVSVSDEAGFRAAWTAGGTIDLTADITLTCTDGGGNGVAATSTGTAIVVNGNDHTIEQTCTTGFNNGVLEQSGDGDVTLDRVTITGGSTDSQGGGLNMQFNASTAALTINASTITDNFACLQGGGIANSASGPMVITNSTLTGNSTANWGGAIDRGDGGDGSMTIVNSTLTGNRANHGGGAIDSDTGDTVTIAYSTIVSNAVDDTLVCAESAVQQAVDGEPHVASEDDIANICICSGPFVVFGTVVADPLAVGTTGSPPAVNCYIDDMQSEGYNWTDDTQTSADPNYCGFDDPTDKTVPGGDPLLGALGDNGGPTLTRLPLAGSPLIDGVALAACQAGSAAGVTTDQRGIARPQGAGCEIGAVEVEALVVLFTG